jgi:uncharacterized YigZ family protein
MDEYRTMQDISEGLYKEKGSRFIGVAIPVDSVDDVKIRLEHLRKRYHDARHHCYAYRLGAEPYEIRYNDDGEPSGTAGKPIFGQIQSFELTNILIVVIRYFGGVKLGTGGLIQAYRTAAREAVGNGKIITKTWNSLLEIRFDYTRMNDVMHIIKEEDLQIMRQESGEQFCILLEIRQGNLKNMIRKFSFLEKLEWTVI